jgi:hypothetical protein
VGATVRDDESQVFGTLQVWEVCHPHKDVWLLVAIVGSFWLPDADPLGLDIIVTFLSRWRSSAIFRVV